MRRLVPAFALLLVSVVSTMVASAAFADYSPAQSHEEFRRQMLCPSDSTGTNAVMTKVCEHGATAFCGHALSYSNPNCPIEQVAADGVNATNFEAKVAEATNRCKELFQKPAKDCCSNPNSCGVGSMPGAGSGGMEAICKNMEANAKSVKEYNEKVAGTCLGRKELCAFKCDSAYRAFNAVPVGTLANKEAILKPLKDLAQECDSMNAKTTIDQALMLADSEKTAKECNNLAKGNTPPGDDNGGNNDGGNNDGGNNAGGNETAPGGQQPGGGLGDMGPMLQAALPMLMQAMQPQATPTTTPQQPLTCEQNPNMPGCPMPGQGANESWNDAQGTAEAKAEPQGNGEFNLQDTGDIPTPQSLGDIQAAAASSPPTVNAVPNGGGGIPGGGGGGPASLGGGGGGGGAQLGSKADILHGTSSPSGGYSQTNEKMNLKSGDSGGYTYGGGGLHDETMNLADFLPGGKNDPTKRNVAGIGAGTATTNFQIQAKDVNIWNRISERIKSRCSQGLLRDCIP